MCCCRPHTTLEAFHLERRYVLIIMGSLLGLGYVLFGLMWGLGAMDAGHGLNWTLSADIATSGVALGLYYAFVGIYFLFQETYIYFHSSVHPGPISLAPWKDPILEHRVVNWFAVATALYAASSQCAILFLFLLASQNTLSSLHTNLHTMYAALAFGFLCLQVVALFVKRVAQRWMTMEVGDLLSLWFFFNGVLACATIGLALAFAFSKLAPLEFAMTVCIAVDASFQVADFYLDSHCKYYKNQYFGSRLGPIGFFRHRA